MVRIAEYVPSTLATVSDEASFWELFAQLTTHVIVSSIPQFPGGCPNMSDPGTTAKYERV